MVRHGQASNEKRLKERKSTPKKENYVTRCTRGQKAIEEKGWNRVFIIFMISVNLSKQRKSLIISNRLELNESQESYRYNLHSPTAFNYQQPKWPSLASERGKLSNNFSSIQFLISFINDQVLLGFVQLAQLRW